MLLIATTNFAKLTEYRRLLSGYPLRLASLSEAQIKLQPDETGASFAEIALHKARFYYQLSGQPVLADDGGLEVDALGGEPGIHSHRWLGADSSDRTLAHEVVRRMQGVADPRRTARLRCALALVWNDRGAIHQAVVEAALEGTIADRVWPEIRPGFPYRAVFLLPNNCYLGQLGEAAEAEISQRRAAVERASRYLDRIARAHRCC